MKVIPVKQLDFTAAIAYALEIALSGDDWADRPLMDFENWLAAPILRGNMLMAFIGSEPVALATHAFLGEDQALNLIEGGTLIGDDWDSGNTFWAIDVIAKPGRGSQFARILRRQHVIPGIPTYWYRTRHGKVRKFSQIRSH